MSFLGGFTDRFAVALGVWPFASVVLTLPILAFLYNRDGRLRFWSVIGAYVSVLYGLGLVFFTLWPLPSGDSGLGITCGVAPQLDPFAFIGDIRRDGSAAVFQILANIAFFVPLGFVFKIGLRMKLLPSVVLAFFVSLLIESAQLTGLFGMYAYSYRTFDVNDLAWNTMGALGGWFVALLMSRMFPKTEEKAPSVNERPGIVHRSVAFLLDMTLIGLAGFFAMVAISITMWFFGFDLGQSMAVVGYVTLAVMVGVFCICEVLMPWLRGGQTPGGAFVRMTIESHSRTQGRRIMFYAARVLTIVACIVLWPIMPVVVIAYYLLRRQMPYDAIG